MMKKNTMKKYLGPKETEVIARLSYEKINFITQEQFDRYFGFNSSTRKQVIFRLKKKGILISINRGVYYYSPLESGPSGRNVNDYLIPSVLFPKGDYYVGYSTMYNYYGFTEQIYQTMYILNTRIQREKVIKNTRFKMVKVSQKRIYGLRKINIENANVKVSDKERTLVDLIYFSEPVGGLQVAFEILIKQVLSNKIDISKLIKYTSRYPSVSTRKRIGFVLEKNGISENRLIILRNTVKNTSLTTLYNTKTRKGKINKRWMVIENAA
ncbi:MAG: type IV toxin-antitoxin system AbiEi family antitoxin [Elusimicrobiota bacterium]